MSESKKNTWRIFFKTIERSLNEKKKFLKDWKFTPAMEKELGLGIRVSRGVLAIPS